MESVSSFETVGELLTIDNIVKSTYENLENGLGFQTNLPGYTSDVYTPMDTEKLGKFLSLFDIAKFNELIEEG